MELIQDQNTFSMDETFQKHQKKNAERVGICEWKEALLETGQFTLEEIEHEQSQLSLSKDGYLIFEPFPSGLTFYFKVKSREISREEELSESLRRFGFSLGGGLATR